MTSILEAIPAFADGIAHAVTAVCYFFIAFVLVNVVRRIRTPFQFAIRVFIGFFVLTGMARIVSAFGYVDGHPLHRCLRFGISACAVLACIALFRTRKRLFELIRATRVSQSQREELGRSLEELELSESRFRLLVNSVRDYAIYFLDPQGRVVSGNEGAKRVKGYEEPEILGKHFSIFYTPEDVQAGVPDWELRNSLETGSSEFEGWRVRKDGSKVWVNSVIAPIRDSSGHLVGFAIVTRDLTDRRLAENALKESEKFLDSLLENIPNMIFVKDARDLRFVRFNRAGEKLLGYPREKFIGKSDYDFFPKEQADFFVEQDCKVLERRQILEILEEPISTADGIRTLHTRKIPILDADGTPRYLLGISEDVTERKIAEAESLRVIREQAALAERETAANRAAFLAEASTLLASSLDYHANLKRLTRLVVPILADWCSISLVGADGELGRVAVFHADPAMAEALEQLNAKYPPRADQSRGIRKVIESGRPLVTYEVPDSQLVAAAEDQEHLQLMRALGCSSCIVVPILSREKVHGAITLVSSSPEYHFNADDVRVAEELGRRAGVAIDNALLYEAAQKAIESRDEFLSIASHELKTPITALKLQLQLARRGTDAEKGLSPSPLRLERTLDVSISQVNRLTDLIDDLLDVSRIEAGRLSMHLERLDLSQLVSRMVERFGEHFQAEGGQIELRAPEEPVWVLGDSFRLEQVVLNLLSNATKYGGKKPVILEVRREDSGRAQLLCRDQGIGIPQDRIDHIFERFERAVRYNEISGLGLGLYITREIVRAHRGEIRVSSVQGQGSTFTVEFPLPEEVAAPAGPGLQQRESPAEKRGATSKDRQLV